MSFIKGRPPRPTIGSSHRCVRHSAERERAYNKFMRSNAWKRKRNWKLESTGWLCENCPPVKPRIATQVHHLNYVRFGGDELLADLQSLCEFCHRKLHRVSLQHRGLWLSLRVNAEHAMTQFGVDIRDRLIASYDH